MAGQGIELMASKYHAGILIIGLSSLTVQCCCMPLDGVSHSVSETCFHALLYFSSPSVAENIRLVTNKSPFLCSAAGPYKMLAWALNCISDESTRANISFHGKSNVIWAVIPL